MWNEYIVTIEHLLSNKMERQVSKEEREWNKGLSTHLERYGLIREWSDLANWLTKLKQILSELRQGMPIS